VRIFIYIVLSVAWFGLGVAVGQWLCRMSNDVHQIKEKLVGEPDDGASEAEAEEKRARADLLGRILGLVVVLAAVASVLVSLDASRETTAATRRLAAITACQRDYNQRFTVALQARQAITDEDRAALDELVVSVFSATTRDASRDALAHYIDRRRQADAARRAHPLPAPADGNCGTEKARR
jgi:hypothetical protein